MKRKLGIMLASGLGAALTIGAFAEPASAEPISCSNQWIAVTQAQQTYDAWNNLVWTFENSAVTSYTMGSDGVVHETIHVDIQGLNGTWGEYDLTPAEYSQLDSAYQGHLTLAGDRLAQAENDYGSVCGF
jgi:hypothetical protein